MLHLSSISKAVTEPNRQQRVLFDDLDLHTTEAQRSLAIVGRSGSGKTTLLRILAGLDVDYTGSYTHRGQNMTKSLQPMAAFRFKHIGVVTQQYDLLDDRNVLRNIMIGQPRSRELRPWAQECLELVGLPGYGSRRVKGLSGGEAQRVAIARALVKRPDIVIADEPTGALDIETEDAVLDVFDRAQDRGVQFIIATHSPRVARRCQTQLLIEDKQLRMWTSPTESAAGGIG